MSINLNINPYYDDFDENKNYHKILFSPGNVSQARELTQQQTILQHQLHKLGKFLLSEGAKISGANLSFDYSVKIVKVLYSETDLEELSNVLNLYVVGETSNLIGKITDVYLNSNELCVKPINVSNNNTFFPEENLKIFNTKQEALNYLLDDSLTPTFTMSVLPDTVNIINNVSGNKFSKELVLNTTNIEIGDIISSNNMLGQYCVVSVPNTNIAILNQQLEENFSNISVYATKKSSRNSLEVSVSEGVFFSNKHLIKCASQSIVPNPKTQYPNVSIGLKIDETIADYVDDSSLLDPAIQSTNYSAPGADRYIIKLELVSKPLANNDIQSLTASERYIELTRIKDGQVGKILQRTVLGELQKTLARQLNDHAGNFIIDPFKITVNKQEFASNTTNSFSIQISPGKAYVNGNEFTTNYPTIINVNKAKSIETSSNSTIDTYYGSSILVKDFYGLLDITTSSPIIELHSSYNTTANTLIGNAILKNYQWAGNNTYRLFLQEIKLTKPNTTFSNTKCCIFQKNNYTNYEFKANLWLSSTNTAVLIDQQKPSQIFKINNKNVKDITEIKYDKPVISRVICSANSFSIAVSNSYSEKILGGIGAISTPIKNQYFTCITKNTNGNYVANTIIKSSDFNLTLSNTANQATFSLVAGKTYSGNVEVLYNIQYTTSQQPKNKYLNTANLALSLNYKDNVSLGYSDVYKINDIFKISSLSSYKGYWNSSTIYYPGNYILVKNNKTYEVYECKIDNQNKNPTTEYHFWNQITSVPAAYYKLNNGQKEEYYDHGSIYSYANLGNCVICFDYFNHSNGAFLTKDSYSTANIASYKIPVFTSPTKQVYKLRDCIDFRPRRTNNTNTFDSYTSISAPIPKISANTLSIPGANLSSFIIPANTDFIGTKVSYNYYLPRIDKVILSENLQFKIIEGKEKINPTPPEIPKGSLSLATIYYNSDANEVNDYRIVYDSHRRYTMDNIGQLDKRISRIEYYNSLNLAEIGTLNNSKTNTLLSQRLQSGILVDNFSSYSVSDVESPEFTCQISFNENCCQPIKTYDSFILDNSIDWHEISYVLPPTKQLTIPYFPFDEDYDPNNENYNSFFATNLSPTGTHIINPFDHISFEGTMMLNPPKDNWTEYLGELIVTESKNIESSFGPSVTDNIPNLSQLIQKNVLSQALLKYKNLDTVIQGYARPLRIYVSVFDLCPHTKMYAFIDDIMVNAYCTPTNNPVGYLPSVTIKNAGEGYDSSNTIINVIGSNTTTAIITAVVENGRIVGADILNTGSGYTKNEISIEVIGSGVGAVIEPSFNLSAGNDLFTDITGNLNYFIDLPNNQTLKFKQGNLKFSVSSRPVNPEFGHSKASSIFQSSGNGGFSIKPIQIFESKKYVSNSSYRILVKDFILYPPEVSYEKITAHTISNTSITNSGVVSYNYKTILFAGEDAGDFIILKSPKNEYSFVSCSSADSNFTFHSKEDQNLKIRYIKDKDYNSSRTYINSTFGDFERWKTNFLLNVSCSFQVFANYDNLDYYLQCEETIVTVDANNNIISSNTSLLPSVYENDETFNQAINKMLQLSETNRFFKFTDIRGIKQYEKFSVALNPNEKIIKIKELSKSLNSKGNNLFELVSKINNAEFSNIFYTFKDNFVDSIKIYSEITVNKVFDQYINYAQSFEQYQNIESKVAILDNILDIKNISKELLHLINNV